MKRLSISLFLLLIKFLSIFCTCPRGAFEGTDSKTCYTFHGSDAADFYTAEETCARNINGHLASISDSFTDANLASTLKQILLDPQAPVWIGGYRVNNSWTWTDGKPFSYINWEKGEPKVGNNCAYINPPDGKWISADCSQPKPYLCEIPGTQSIFSTPKPIITLACDSEWTYWDISNACYKLIYGYNWMDAENECVKEGAHLASIHSLLENDFLSNFSQSGTTMDNWESCVWIGLNDLGGVGDWNWTDGKNFDYKNWAPPEPYGLNVNRCVLLDPDLISNHEDYFQRWGVILCSYVMRAAICQKPSNLNIP